MFLLFVLLGIGYVSVFVARTFIKMPNVVCSDAFYEFIMCGRFMFWL